jgi:pilus assembly protein CpaB
MRLRNLLLLVLAVLLAGGTAMLARSYLAAQRVRQVVQAPPPPQPVRSVLVAHANIARCQPLKPADLAWQEWPDRAITPAYFVAGGKQSPQNLSGVAVNPIAAGTPITTGMIISGPEAGGRCFAATLQPGMRAIQVTADLPAGTSQGDRVDMLVNFPLPKGYDESRSGWPQRDSGWIGTNGVETVLHGLRIIKIVGLQIEAGKPAAPRSAGAAPVLFEVTPKQAEIIALAQRMGTLTFTLDSLRPGPRETASTARDVMLAAAHNEANPAAAAAVTVLRQTDANRLDPPDNGGPTYTTDVDVNPMLRTPTREIEVSATILRGGGKPENVSIWLRCTETACAHFDNKQIPARLVGTDALIGSR